MPELLMGMACKFNGNMSALVQIQHGPKVTCPRKSNIILIITYFLFAGKSTTTAMLSFVLNAMGDNLISVVGANVPQVWFSEYVNTTCLIFVSLHA